MNPTNLTAGYRDRMATTTGHPRPRDWLLLQAICCPNLGAPIGPMAFFSDPKQIQGLPGVHTGLYLNLFTLQGLQFDCAHFNELYAFGELVGPHHIRLLIATIDLCRVVTRHYMPCPVQIRNEVKSRDDESALW